MPKLRRPDGRVVSVSATGVQALRARGYTEPGAPPADDGAPQRPVSRKELDEQARALRVEAPEKLPNKDAVIAAIRDAEGGR